MGQGEVNVVVENPGLLPGVSSIPEIKSKNVYNPDCFAQILCEINLDKKCAFFNSRGSEL